MTCSLQREDPVPAQPGGHRAGGGGGDDLPTPLPPAGLRSGGACWGNPAVLLTPKPLCLRALAKGSALPCSLLPARRSPGTWDLGPPFLASVNRRREPPDRSSVGLGVWGVQHGARLRTGARWPGRATAAGREGPSQAPRPGKWGGAAQGQANLTVDGAACPRRPTCDVLVGRSQASPRQGRGRRHPDACPHLYVEETHLNVLLC